jgi:hypothetical protein
MITCGLRRAALLHPFPEKPPIFQPLLPSLLLEAVEEINKKYLIFFPMLEVVNEFSLKQHKSDRNPSFLLQRR